MKCSNRPRQCLRFSIRTLVAFQLIATLGIAVVVGNEVDRADRERRAQMSLGKLGSYKIRREESRSWRWVPRQLKRFIPDELRMETVALDLSESEYTDELMLHVAKLSRLRYLNLRGSEITKRGLNGLEGLDRLEVLDLSATNLEGSALLVLTKLDNLREINLTFARGVSDKQLADLARMDQLISLGLMRTEITDEGLRLLEKDLELRYLDVRLTSVSAHGLSCISDLKNLRQVWIWRTQVKNEEAATLKASFGNCRITMQPDFSFQGIQRSEVFAGDWKSVNER